jgi:transcriptional regulator with XRE-family HTH domain
MSQTAYDIAKKLLREIDRARLKRSEVLLEAGVSRATFWRWLQNISEPRKASITAIRDAIQRLSVKDIAEGE